MIIFAIPIITVLIGIIGLTLYGDHFKYLINGLNKIINSPVVNGVTDKRIEQFSYIFNSITQNPILTLFGNGPAKGVMDDVESIYSYYLFRYGIFGLFICFLLPIVFAAYSSMKIANIAPRNTEEYILFRSLQLWFMVVPIISLGNNHTEQIRVSFFHLILLALVAARFDKRP